MPFQKSIFCYVDFGSTIALDLQEKLKPFLYSSQEQMAMRSFLEYIALSCSSEVLFIKFPVFLTFLQVYFSDIYSFVWDRVAAFENIVQLSI